MKKNYINLDEVYYGLSDNKTLSRELNQELSCICDLRNSDDYYIFADLIRDRRANVKWQLISDGIENVLMELVTPKKELRPTIYNLLTAQNLIHFGELSNTIIVQ